MRKNDYEKVRMALKCQRNLDLEQPDNYYGMTLIMLAAQYGEENLLKMLSVVISLKVIHLTWKIHLYDVSGDSSLQEDWKMLLCHKA